MVIRKIRDAILDEVFTPGDWLAEVELAEKFEVSRSPIREALLAREKEGTIILSPFKGAIVKPLSHWHRPRFASLEVRSSGLPARSIQIWNNYVSGVVPANPQDRSYTGSGIVTNGDTFDPRAATAHVDIAYDQVAGGPFPEMH
jgi:Bacterial regulatory proteins, gntR family